MTAAHIITPQRYEVYESAILSGQVPHRDVPKLLGDQPAFAEWYRRRAEARQR